MKRQVFIFFLTLLPLGSSLIAQSISKKYPDVTERVQIINTDISFEKITLLNEEFMPQMTDGGGELTGYFKKGIIQKITRKIVLSYGIETYDYYFINEKLMVIYETFYVFVPNDSLGTVDQTKTELNFIGTYYFKNHKLIDSETVGHNRFENEDIDMEAILLKETEENLFMLKQRRAKAAKRDLVPGWLSVGNISILAISRKSGHRNLLASDNNSYRPLYHTQPSQRDDLSVALKIDDVPPRSVGTICGDIIRNCSQYIPTGCDA